MANERRDVKESAATRELVYGVINDTLETALNGIGYEIVGRAVEGIIVRDKATDLYVMVKAIAKGLDFDAEDAMEAYADAANKAKERANKAKAKAAKDNAKRAKDKEKEVKGE